MTKINYNGLTDKEQFGIAFLVGKGFNEGVLDNVSWKVEIEEEEERQNIVNMINEGFTSGYYPDWQLSFQRN